MVYAIEVIKLGGLYPTSEIKQEAYETIDQAKKLFARKVVTNQNWLMIMSIDRKTISTE